MEIHVLVPLLSVLMAYSGVLNLLFVAGIWCSAYAFVAVFEVFKLFNQGLNGFRTASYWPCRQWQGDFLDFTSLDCFIHLTFDLFLQLY